VGFLSLSTSLGLQTRMAPGDLRTLPPRPPLRTSPSGEVLGELLPALPVPVVLLPVDAASSASADEMFPDRHGELHASAEPRFELLPACRPAMAVPRSGSCPVHLMRARMRHGLEC
jgi:hypothetical protein